MMLPIQLFVEGPSDFTLFSALIEYLSLKGIQVRVMQGNEIPPETLSSVAKSRGVKSIGIVLDADRNAAAAFRKVQGALRKSGLPVPKRPETIALGSPKVSVMILPGQDRTGMLETLLCESIAQGPENACIDSFFRCLADAGLPAPKRPEKSRARAYLATKPDPNVSVGVAGQKRYWDFAHPAFGGLRAYLGTL